MRTARNFVVLIRRIRRILAEAGRDWDHDPEMSEILRRMAAYFARLLGGEPDQGTVQDARRALRAPRSWKPQGGHGRNGNGTK